MKLPFALAYPEELPISAKRAEIGQAIAAHQIIILCGETGSGKTTQVPKICLELGRGKINGGGLIGHTQPRRIAASSTARRIAQELNTPFGEVVGYQVRFHETLASTASIKLMTDGILLAETQHDPLLKKYDTLIIDEAHERSLNIDFLLGYLKQIAPKRPDLKIIITSATIDAARFAAHFGQGGTPAPVIEVSGRLYPVELRYHPWGEPVKGEQNKPSNNNQQAIVKNKESRVRDDDAFNQSMVAAVDELCHLGSGDVLVFLPGEREIKDAEQALRKHHPPHTEILPLYARLSAQDQERIFKASNRRRIVLATNVAETSLTVPGIRYVVDSGMARVKRYSYRNKVEQLQVEPISQAAANQRAGRCGRVAAGVCIRLYEETDFAARAPFGDPEILRSSLAAVILRMKALHLGAIEQFPFIDAPPMRAITDGYQLLAELGAINETHEHKPLTALGKELAKLPLDPRLGRMLIAAREGACLHEVLVIASALSVQDPRERPMGVAGVDEAHKKFQDEDSEFLSWLKLWNFYDTLLKNKTSNSALREQCRQNFLSPLRLREWRDVHTQLHATVTELGWRVGSSVATFEQIHLALLAGLLGNIGCKLEETSDMRLPTYLGARAIKFQIAPHSSLAKKAGRWVMAAELMETHKLYARTIAKIKPEWVEKTAAHLIKNSWAEPHWEKSSGEVVALERGTVYGLTVYQGRRSAYARQGASQAAHARELFIREGLVAGELHNRPAFLQHNLKLVREIEGLEHKARRQDVLVDEELIAAFYSEHVPAEVVGQASLEKWLKYAPEKTSTLFLKRDDLMRHEAAGITTELYPKTLEHGGLSLALSYHFEPGSLRDGATLSVPLVALNQISLARCIWLVPGMLKEKVHLLLKSLPQKMRRHCVPLPDYAAHFCARAAFGQGELLEALIADVREHTGQLLKPSDFKWETIPAHLHMNFRVVDEHGRQLELGRSLPQLRAQFAQESKAAFAHMVSESRTVANSRVQIQATPSHEAKNQPPLPKSTRASFLAVDDRFATFSEQQESVALERNASSFTRTGSAQASAVITEWNFGELPELLEIEKAGQAYYGYPALQDCLTHCEINVFDDSHQAAQAHRQGLARLFRLQLKESIKYLEKNLPSLHDMAMHYLHLGTQEELRDDLLSLSIERSCLAQPLPRNAQEFMQRKEEGRARINLLAQEVARLAGTILLELHQTQKKITSLKNANPTVLHDLNEQLHALIFKHFMCKISWVQLTHLPRYLKAMQMRVDKLRADPARDAARMSEIAQLQQPYKRLLQARKGQFDERLNEFRWLLEELRVALFAQELRTPMPVSVKRLQKVWAMFER